MSTRRSPEIAAMKPTLPVCWLALGIALLCPIGAWCESLNALGTEYSVLRRLAQDKYENKSAHEELAQRSRFEEKQLRAQQHRDAVEKRWMDKKGVKATQTSQTP